MPVLVLALCFLLLAACGDAPAPASPSLVGTWVSEPTLSQLGHVVQTFTFESDGRVTMTGEFADMELAAKVDPELADAAGLCNLKTAGRYEARDGTLRVAMERTFLGGKELDEDEPYEQTMTYRFEGEVLVLEDPDGETTRLRRR